jgi:hypothetical protein
MTAPPPPFATWLKWMTPRPPRAAQPTSTTDRATEDHHESTEDV